MTPSSGHYSIGEVLSLLQSDFPDVTISKIRFLESQGLIDPERTPSGYRRFLEHDLERLRWILVQQRDHYLPLKVIRERLDAGEPFPEEPPVDGDGGADDVGDEAIPADVEPVPAVPPAEALPVQPSTEEPAPSSGGSQTPDAPPAPAPGALPDEGPGRSGPPPPQDRPSSPAEGEPVPKNRGEPQTGDQPVPTQSTGEAAAPESSPPPISARPPVARPRDARPATSAGASVGKEAGVGDGPAEVAAPAEVALTRDELARASGCSPSVLGDLERFGLLRGTSSGSTVLYDHGALTVATLAARFASHGLEPRHLRSFRQAAEREIGLFAQVVGPLLQRRDPSAHALAVEAVTELVDLAAQLHRVLIDDLAAEELRVR